MTASQLACACRSPDCERGSLADWGQYMTPGAVTYAVGEVPGLCTVYLDRAEAEAEAAADELKAWGPPAARPQVTPSGSPRADSRNRRLDRDRTSGPGQPDSRMLGSGLR